MHEMERALARLVACRYCLKRAVMGEDWAGAAVLTEALNQDIACYRERLGSLVLFIGGKLAQQQGEGDG